MSINRVRADNITRTRFEKFNGSILQEHFRGVQNPKLS